MPLAFVRASIVHEVEAGWSLVFRMFLEHALVGRGNIGDDGVELASPRGRPRLVVFTLHGVITDAPALSRLFAAKDSKAIVPCVSCLNLVANGSGPAREDAS